MRYLAVELAPRGIRVNAVSAGVVETGALEHFPNKDAMLEMGAGNPVGRLVTPEDVAGARDVPLLARRRDDPGPDARHRRRLEPARRATRAGTTRARRVAPSPSRASPRARGSPAAVGASTRTSDRRTGRRREAGAPSRTSSVARSSRTPSSIWNSYSSVRSCPATRSSARSMSHSSCVATADVGAELEQRVEHVHEARANRVVAPGTRSTRGST